MEQAVKQDLYQEFIKMEKDVHQIWPLGQNLIPSQAESKQVWIETAFSVCNLLKSHPYMSGRSISEKARLNKAQLVVVYKMIQRSNVAQDYFKSSKNKDYFNVVNHYFNSQLYTLVFFVGTSCPSRCLFCPNVKIDKKGRRRLVTYNPQKGKKLSIETLNRIFSDLARIKAKGNNILVKISGGLEPLTSAGTMKIIIDLALQLDIRVKLFTNGLLFKNPEKRNIALSANDVRISLSTSDEKQYQNICFSDEANPRFKQALSLLKENIRKLVRERNDLNPKCQIGFNTVVLPENHLQLVSLLELARELRIDYVDVKPDYFSNYDTATRMAMENSIHKAQKVAHNESYQSLYVNFTGSLSSDDLFWQSWPGACDAIRQSEFKLFITPFGDCSPVHYGAFPKSETSFQGKLPNYSIGEVNDEQSLLDVLRHPLQPPKIDLKKLNPFELMLHLEIMREEDDQTWGLPISVSPYHTNLKEEIPLDIFAHINRISTPSMLESAYQKKKEV
jgi:MoaA/NifB/PqqE/SkfB family radical SAM enzyme